MGAGVIEHSAHAAGSHPHPRSGVCLVTGGAGFIGSHLVDALLHRGHRVVVVDDLSSGRREHVSVAAELHVVDLCDGPALERIVDDLGPEHVFHLAAQTSVSVSTREPLRDARVNILGTIGLLEACVRARVRRFVFSSTGGAMYGDVGTMAADHRSCPARPASPYGCAKLAGEAYVRAVAERTGMAATILRYANVYGPRQDPHGEAGVVAIFIQRLLRREICRLYAREHIGDEGCVRDYIYVDDVVRANLDASAGCFDSAGLCNVLDIGTGVPTTTRALHTQLAAMVDVGMGIDGRAELVDCEPRPGDIGYATLDPSGWRSCSATTALPIVGLEQGLAATTAWFRSHGSNGR